MERQLSPVASHHNRQRHIRIQSHDLLDFFETLDRASADAKDHIARLEASLFRRTPRRAPSATGWGVAGAPNPIIFVGERVSMVPAMHVRMSMARTVIYRAEVMLRG
jgi:hypothetical protein